MIPVFRRHADGRTVVIVTVIYTCTINVGVYVCIANKADINVYKIWKKTYASDEGRYCN